MTIKGNQEMSDFEALGRYVSASKRATLIKSNRDKKLADLGRLIVEATWHTDSSVFSNHFDSRAATKLLQEAAQLETEMTEAVNEANAVACLAKEQELQIREYKSPDSLDPMWQLQRRELHI